MSYNNLTKKKYLVLNTEHYKYILFIIQQELNDSLDTYKENTLYYNNLYNVFMYLKNIICKESKKECIFYTYDDNNYIEYTNLQFEFINNIIRTKSLDYNYILPLFNLSNNPIDYTDCITVNITYENEQNKKNNKKMKIHKNVKLFEGIIFNRLAGIERDADELSIIIQQACEDIYELTLKYNPCEVIEKYKSSYYGNPEVYTLLTNYIKYNLLTIHTNYNKKFCILKNSDDIIIFIDGLIRNKKMVNFLSLTDPILCLGDKTTEPKKKFMLRDDTHYVYKCPCVFNTLTNEECSYYIDINNTISLRILNRLKNINNNVKNKIEEISLLSTFKCLNPDRCYPSCPLCNNKFMNKPAIDSEKCIECELVHPTQVTCPNCNYVFCTDCKQSHPETICRGITTCKDSRACPGCKVETYRWSGCPSMVCTNIITKCINGKELQICCNLRWCYICRLPRTGEGIHFNHHYCPLEDDSILMKNPKWINNPNFKFLKLPDDMAI